MPIRTGLTVERPRDLLAARKAERVDQPLGEGEPGEGEDGGAVRVDDQAAVDELPVLGRAEGGGHPVPPFPRRGGPGALSDSYSGCRERLRTKVTVQARRPGASAWGRVGGPWEPLAVDKETAALLASGLAVVVSLIAAAYTRRATIAAERAERANRAPKLVIRLHHGDTFTPTYAIAHHGPEDLDEVVIRCPTRKIGGRPAVGSVLKWDGDIQRGELSLGRLRVGEDGLFRLRVEAVGEGQEVTIPGFARKGKDKWPIAFTVRLPADPLVSVF